MFTEPEITMPAWFFFALLLALLVLGVDYMYLSVKVGRFRVQRKARKSQRTREQLPSTNHGRSPETALPATEPTATSRQDTIQLESE